MAAAVLTADTEVSADVATSLVRLLRAYVLVWTATLAVALMARCVPGAADAVGSWLGAALSAQANPPPTLGRAAGLAWHNLCVLSVPLLLATSGVARHRGARYVVDVIVLLDVVVQTAIVGLAIGAYGGRLAPFVPHLPLEWLGLAASLAAWWAARRGERDRRMWHRLGVLAAILVAAVLVAAALETYATPHR